MKQPRRGAGLCHLSWLWMLLGCWGAGGAVSSVHQGRAWLQTPSHCPSQGQPIPGHWALPGDGLRPGHGGSRVWAAGQWCRSRAAAASGAHMVSQAQAGDQDPEDRGVIRTLVKGHGTFQTVKDGWGHLFFREVDIWLQTLQTFFYPGVSSPFSLEWQINRRSFRYPGNVLWQQLL